MLNKYVIVAFFLLLLTCGALLNEKVEQAARADRMESNFNQAAKDNKKLNLELNEFKDYISFQDTTIAELLHELEIKPKEVVRVETVKILVEDTTKHEVETVEIPDTKVPEKESVTRQFAFAHTPPCFAISGFVTLMEGSNPKVTFTEVLHENALKEVYYKDRNEWKFLFFKTKFLGERVIKVARRTECGEATHDVIRVRKKFNPESF